MQPTERTLSPFAKYMLILLGVFLSSVFVFAIILLIQEEDEITLQGLRICLFVLPAMAFPLVYVELYQRIAGNSPKLTFHDHITGHHLNKPVVYATLEAMASIVLLLGIAFVLRPSLLTSIVFALCSAAYFAVRLNYVLQPARDERAAPLLEAAARRAEAERQTAALLTAPPTTASLIRQEYVVIGTAQDSLPIYYREERGNEERFRHTYIIGASGYGKTTCLCNLIAQDIYHGNGVIVLSAEDDFFPKLLSYIPKQRMDDLIYFDPADLTPPIIGFNPFTDQEAGETRTILKRAMGSDFGYTIEPVIDNAVSALAGRPQATFADLMRLIDPMDKTMRASFKTDPDLDEDTRNFWKRYDETTYYRKSYESVRARFSPFAKSPISTTLAVSSFSFKTAMQSSRIIFLDLSHIQDTAVTMGQLLLASIEQALPSRNPLDESLLPYYLYIDEFQLYAADSKDTLIKVFNGARKRKFGVNVAHQSMANIPDELMKTITQSASTKIVMHLSADDSPKFAKQLQLGSPIPLQNLKIGQAYTQTPTHQMGISVTLPSSPVTQLRVVIPPNVLKTRSKQNFGSEPSVPSTEHVTDQPEEPKPPVGRIKQRYVNRHRRLC